MLTRLFAYKNRLLLVGLAVIGLLSSGSALAQDQLPPSSVPPAAAPPAETPPIVNPPAEAKKQDDSTKPPDNGTAVPNADERGPLLKKYIQIRQELARLDTTISEKLANASLSSTARYKMMMDEIATLRRNKLEKNTELLLAALDAYLEAPDRYREVNEDLTRYMRSLLGEQTSTLSFAPHLAVDVAKKVVDAGSKNLNILFYGSHAAYCLNDFALAKQWLDEIEKRGAPIDKQVRAQVEAALEKWNRELKLQEADALAILPQVLLKTDLGDITIELFETEAPNTVANFIYLVEKKFYDNTYIFFSQPGRLWSAGCSRADGTTNAGYYIADEYNRPDARHHFTGTVAMNGELPNSTSALFSILEQPTPVADGKSTPFGRVIQGMDVVYKTPTINPAAIATGTKANKIISATVIRKKSHPYAPQTIPLPESVKSEKQ